MSVIERAYKFQECIERRIHKIKPLSFGEFSFLLFFAFLVLGVLLFVICFIQGIHPLMQHDTSSPVLYFGLSFCMLVSFILWRHLEG